ncbi:MAG: SPOR domain-containing protein [bacterium]
MRRLAPCSCLLLFLLATNGQAQSAPNLSPNDPIFRRARRLVSEGNGTAGRALVDSILKREEEGSTGYGNALFWRGALAETAADAERDYRRVIVEYPVSAYSDDALLAIAELEQARGDRAGALAHLQRFVKEHPVSAARGTAAFAAARLAFEQRDTRVGCAMITEARASVPTTDVELRNQIDYFSPRCATGDIAATTPVVSAPAASVAPAPVRDSTPVVPKKPAGESTHQKASSPAAVKPPEVKTPPATPAPTTKKAPVEAPPAAVVSEPQPKPVIKSGGSFTIQLAAFNTRAEADRLVKKLGASGVKARVSGAAKPFRVRLDFYTTRQEALDEVASLKQRGIIGFVTTETPAPAGKTP